MLYKNVVYKCYIWFLGSNMEIFEDIKYNFLLALNLIYIIWKYYFLVLVFIEGNVI